MEKVKNKMSDEQRRCLFFNFRELGFDDDGEHIDIYPERAKEYWGFED